MSARRAHKPKSRRVTTPAQRAQARARKHRHVENTRLGIRSFTVALPVDDLEVTLREAGLLAPYIDEHCEMQAALQKALLLWLSRTRSGQPTRIDRSSPATD